MSTKKKGNKTAMLKNLLTTGSIEKETVTEEVVIDDVVDIEETQTEEQSEEQGSVQNTVETSEEEIIEEPKTEQEPTVTTCDKAIEPVIMTHDEIITEPETVSNDKKTETAPPTICSTDLDDMKKEISDLKKQIFALRTENQNYMTSKDLHKSYMDAMDKKDNELANKKMMNMLEQLSAMREDFFKLCTDMEKKLDKFSPKDILNSFEAYSTDMENILVDAGVFIGKFDYEKLNTVHQRIIDVVPTDDESKNGMIAERMSDGYKFNGRVLFKEKVKIYKFTEKDQTNNKKEE